MVEINLESGYLGEKTRGLATTWRQKCFNFQPVESHAS